LKFYQTTKDIVQNEHKFEEDINLLNAMLSLIDSVVVVINLDRTVHFVNAAFERITGITINEKNYQSIFAFFEDEYLQPLNRGFEYVLKYKTAYVIPNHLVHTKNGQELIFKTSMNYIEIGEKGFIILTAKDLTCEVQLAKVKDIVIRLNNMISKYYSLDEYFDDILRSLVEVIPYVELGSVLLLDENNFITMEANVGYDKEMASKFELKFEETFFYRCGGEDRTKPIIINDIQSYCMNGVTSILDNTHGVDVASSLSSPIIIDGKLRGLLNLDSSRNNIFDNEDLEIMQFLTEQISLVLTSHQLLNQTIYLSRFDQLTGLYNRWYINELESNIIPQCLKDNLQFYYVMMDLNNLKTVNDIYGHISGDVYLKEFALLLKKYSTDRDRLIRIGGDEFVGVFFGIDRDLLISKMDTINQELKSKMKDIVVASKCGFAYGFTEFPKESQKLDEFIKIADQRMYIKKKDMKVKR
jgi:diguanylate cyclase (GGDEF)-like protein/PAS domain S-box-containing protein